MNHLNEIYSLQVYPGMVPHLLTLQEMFFIPLFRELWLATQACAATKAGMEYLLTRPGGQVVVLVPGGAPESLNCDKGEIRASIFMPLKIV